MTRKDKFITITAVILVIIFGCITLHRYGIFAHEPSEIETVLQLAGKNRKELEKVLKHYSNNPADSLKFRAAKFLIVNMPGKHSTYYDAPWNDVATVNFRWTSSSDKQLVLEAYKLGKFLRKDDLTHITASYMINNIELAFKVWNEVPWGKDISFDVFCELILPHRVNTEPLENWREKVLASFADVYKSFLSDSTITAVQACSKVNALLPRFKMDKDYPSMSYSQLMATSRGICDRMAELAVFAMRGLGIPVTYDFTPKRPFSNVGTSWNTVRDKNGKHHIFMGAQTNPGEHYSGATTNNIRPYRQFYGKQQKLTLKQEDIPPLLHNYDYIVDVTSEFGGSDIWFPIPKDYSKEKGLIYLAILQDMEWHPIAWGIVTPQNLVFLSMLSELYLPMYYHNGVQTPIDHPFKYQFGLCRFYHSSLSRSSTRSFTSIAPMSYEWCSLMKGGKFEVSNNKDFSNAKTIHTVEYAGSGYFTVSLKQPSNFRYIRYVSPAGVRCSISELEFYDENNKKFQGTAVGTADDPQKAFDGDVDTFFESTSTPSWIGLDLGESRKITKIRYLSRTDGNGIYEGHEYELFYWNKNEWQSLGRKMADSHILQYKVPDRALLYLKNITKNKIHNRPFTFEYDSQQWF